MAARAMARERALQLTLEPAAVLLQRAAEAAPPSHRRRGRHRRSALGWSLPVSGRCDLPTVRVAVFGVPIWPAPIEWVGVCCRDRCRCLGSRPGSVWRPVLASGPAVEAVWYFCSLRLTERCRSTQFELLPPPSLDGTDRFGGAVASFRRSRIRR